MRRIIRRLEIIADAERYPGEDPAAGAPSVPLLADYLAATPAGAAVLLRPADELELLVPALPMLRLIVVEFPKLGEGRGYTQGRLLRLRHGYTHELRARGALRRDQLYFLARCGFDAFELEPGENLEAALSAFATFSVAYQDGSRDLVAPRLRPPA